MPDSLSDIAKALVAPAKGLLAADESTKTITKRFADVVLEASPELNCKYRQMLFTTPGVEEFISGVIMYDETVRQKTDSDIPFPKYLADKGIIPGIKVDEGLEPFGKSEETVTKGLEGLESRFEEYKKLGLKFTKWRAAIKITDIYPSEEFLQENIGRMTEYASISQENGFVPIVEPEVLMDGAHTTSRCEEVTTKTLTILFEKLKNKNVSLNSLLLKTNMILPGKDNGVSAESLEVANATLRTLKNSVPEDVPGVLFLSGGQSPQEATTNLNEINKLKGYAPWELSFSFARALQSEALQTWQGKDENIKKAQQVFYKRASLVSQARQGLYKPEMEENG